MSQGEEDGKVGSPETHIGLALSGGTARSVVHVGVLKALEEENIPVAAVAGTSGGALVGALYAAGASPSRLEELAASVRWRDLASLTLPRMGFLSSEGIARFVVRQVGDISFDQLQLPLAVVTTDLVTGEKVILRHGSVPQAVRASCSVPQLYAPVEIDGRLLVDGGLVEYLPVATTRALGVELVLAVNAASQAARAGRPQNMVQVVLMVIGIVARWNAIQAEEEADIVIRPDVAQFGSFALDEGPRMVEAGYAAARRVIPQLRQELARRRGVLHRVGRFFRRGV